MSQPTASNSIAAAPRGPLSVYSLLLINGLLVAGVYAFAKVGSTNGVAPLGVLAWQVAFAALVVGGAAALRGELPA
ncbi:MAG TPA: hypothetical protein VFR86_20280, partial [Burkholderiaceae bacterium]|nr:hypothetical protein [Burkholderiaceae bacterium]